MGKAILISIVFALIGIPILAATDASPRRGLKRAVAGLVTFAFVYAFLLAFVWPRVE
jgi:hypothetical protein